MTDNKINWGVLGYARIAKNWVIPAIENSKNSTFYAIAAKDSERFNECKERYRNVKTYNNYEDLLSDPEVQAVYIPLPNGLHKEWVIKAARKGKHILCEKPISLNSSQCTEMIEECKRNGVKLMEAFMYRYTHRTKKVMELLSDNAIGEIKHIYSTFSVLLERTSDYRWDPAQGGGALYDLGCYPINFIGMILKSSPVSMTANYIAKGDVDLRFSASLKYENGIIADISCGFDSHFNQLSQITGTDGSILIPDTFHDNAGKIILKTNQFTKEIDVEACERYVLEIEDFSDSIINNKEPYLGLDESLRNINIIEQLLLMTYKQ